MYFDVGVNGICRAKADNLFCGHSYALGDKFKRKLRPGSFFFASDLSSQAAILNLGHCELCGHCYNFRIQLRFSRLNGENEKLQHLASKGNKGGSVGGCVGGREFSGGKKE